MKIFKVFFIGAILISSITHVFPRNSHYCDADSWTKNAENEERIKYLKPDSVVDMMKIKKGDTLADIGAGTGLFTRRFAVAAGPSGMAYGFDIEQSMIDYMTKDARSRKLENYMPVLIDPDKPDFTAYRFDRVFLSNTYHHIKNRISYFSRVKNHMKPGGRLIIVDFIKKKAPFGPPVSMKIDKKDVIAEMKKAGFILLKEEDYSEYMYYIEFILNQNDLKRDITDPD